MNPIIFRGILACALTSGALAPSQAARADALPATLVAGSVTVLVQAAPGGSIATVRRGDRILATTELPTLDAVSIEPAQSAGRPLFLFRGQGASTSAAGILDLHPSPHWIWIGRTDLRGDPGERVANIIEARDVDGDARPDLVVAQAREGVSLCSESGQHALFPRAVDRSGALRPVRSQLAREGLVPLTATPLASTPTARFNTLQQRAISSALGTPEDARLLSPAIGLSDGSNQTGWTEGRGQGGAGEFIRFDWSGPSMTSLVLEGGPTIALPRELIVEADAMRFVVALPGDATRVAIAFPAPISPRCLALVLSDASRLPNDARLGFSEVRALTTAENAEGLSALVDMLVTEGSDGDRAALWLRAAGSEGVTAVSQAWDRLGVLGRRRAIAVARAQPAHPDAASILGRGALDSAQEVRADAIGLLSRSIEGRTRLALLATEDAPGTEERARTLLVSRDAIAMSAMSTGAMQSALARPTTLESPALRSLLAARVGSDLAARSELTSLPSDALAALAVGAATLPPSYAVEEREGIILWASETATARNDLENFITRYRIAHALVGTTSSSNLDRWLENQALHADEWMMRAEALAALGSRATPALLDELEHDASPRVRVVVVELRADASDLAALNRSVASDTWPLVRVAALGRMPDSESRRELVVRLLRDPASAMRASALTLVRDTLDRSGTAVSGVGQILDDTREWPHVTERAIGAAAALCTAALGPSLTRVIRRGAAADAAAADLDNAQAALRVALQLGGPSADDARRAAMEGASSTVFAPLLEHPVTPCATRDSLPTPR